VTTLPTRSETRDRIAPAAHRPLFGFGAFRICLVTLLAVATLLQGQGAAAEPLPVRELAPGLFVHAGVQAESSPHNLGDIANIGFIVGAKCVAVIDTGGSVVVGNRLREAVKAATTLPVCYVVNTHIHPDHIFGNAAFKADDPVYVGHARLAAAMAARGRNYRNALLRDLGEAVAASEIIPPTLEVKDALDLDLGGRILRLKAWPTAHTDNDLTVFDTRSETLWLADLLFVEHIPVVDGSLKGWLSVMAEIATLHPQRVIAGHGESADWRRALRDQERYLRTLLTETRAAIKAKRTMQQAVDSVGVDEKDQWLLSEGFHKRNVTAAYAELEWED
jgi:quinoprotein relay system zinc metallohydrolase 2